MVWIVKSLVRVSDTPSIWLKEAGVCRYVGQCIGWVSSVFYLGSRVAQIFKTWSRQSAEGLSIAMFACAITANILYGAGILLRAYAWSDIVSSAPWLLGSLGTVFLDLIIYSQAGLPSPCCTMPLRVFSLAEVPSQQRLLDLKAA